MPIEHQNLIRDIISVVLAVFKTDKNIGAVQK